MNLRRILVLTLGLAALAWSNGAAARTPFQARCEEASLHATATFATRESGYRIDNGMTYRMLTQMKRPVVSNGFVLGLTRTESRVAIQVGGSALQDPASATECVIPRIAVTLYYLPIVVYVASEFAPATCPYQEVLAHELRHLKSYLDYLPKVEERVRSRLAGRFVGLPLYAPSGGGRALLQAEVDRNWMPYLKLEMGRVEGLQAEIDSAQEYARLSKVCSGEVQSLIGSARRTPS